MAYEDKYSITDIKDSKYNNLIISIDEKSPVLLYTPNMDNTAEHFHIELNDKEANKLYMWLMQYFGEM